MKCANAHRSMNTVAWVVRIMRADIFQERIDKKLEKEKRKVEFRIPEKQAKKKQKSITALTMAGI